MSSILTSLILLAELASSLDGRWQADYAEQAGQTLPTSITSTLVLQMTDGRYDLQNDHGTVDLLNENRMVITGTEGPNKGKTIKAIYKRDGDSLTICYDLTGQNFPPGFATAGTKLFLVKYTLTSTK